MKVYKYDGKNKNQKEEISPEDILVIPVSFEDIKYRARQDDWALTFSAENLKDVVEKLKPMMNLVKKPFVLMAISGASERDIEKLQEGGLEDKVFYLDMGEKQK